MAGTLDVAVSFTPHAASEAAEVGRRTTMIKPYYDRDGITIYCADCRDVLPQLEKVDLVLTDPPYCNTLNEEWDRQWQLDHDFIHWLRGILEILPVQPNGSLYCFASSRMLASVERAVAKYFRVLSSITWSKGSQRLGVAGTGIDVSSLRRYWPATERIIFAECEKGDVTASKVSGYDSACRGAKQKVFGIYLAEELQRAKCQNREIASLFPSRTGGITGCVSNWLSGANVPTAEQYETIRKFLNSRNGEQYLRREYEDLRREYEDLRRPFFVSQNDQWTDLWEFPIHKNNLHPAQKPLSLITHSVRISSRSSSVILDPFMGSGTTLVAAKLLGRRAIGIEICEEYCEIAVRRLRQKVLTFNDSD